MIACRSILFFLCSVFLTSRSYAQNTTNPFSPYTPDGTTVLLYHLDGADGGVTPDAGPHGLDGTLVNAALTDDGKFGLALAFPGDAYLQTPDSPLFQSADLTYEAWVRPKTLGYAVLFDNQIRGIPQKYGRLLALGEGVPCAVSASGSHSPSTVLCLDEPIPLNEWTHVAAIFDETNSQLSLAVDGIVMAIETPFQNYEGTSRVVMGRELTDPVAYFNGDIDEVRISSVARLFTPVRVEQSSWGRIKALWSDSSP